MKNKSANRWRLDRPDLRLNNSAMLLRTSSRRGLGWSRSLQWRQRSRWRKLLIEWDSNPWTTDWEACTLQLCYNRAKVIFVTLVPGYFFRRNFTPIFLNYRQCRRRVRFRRRPSRSLSSSTTRPTMVTLAVLKHCSTVLITLSHLTSCTAVFITLLL